MAGKVWMTAAVVAAGMIVAGGGAFAHNTKGEVAKTPGHRAALVRHDNFERLGAAFKTINDEIKKGEPSTQVIGREANTMKALSAQLPTWFPKGSGQEARPKSEAKANIWTDAAGFTAAASNAQTQIAKLQTVSASGDINAIRGQVRATGGACKGCHDKFREKKD